MSRLTGRAVSRGAIDKSSIIECDGLGPVLRRATAAQLMWTTPQTPDGYRGRYANRRWVALIFGVSLTIRLGLVAVDPTVALAHRHEGINVAESLAAGKGFSDPYCCPTGPTAHLAPGYPM